MIELAMVFALGFLVAGLLTLLFLPALWRRAVRLSTRRLEMQMPLSMEEIVAERDQLRAQFATEQRRLEQRVDKLAERHATDLGELGRRATSIAGLEANLSSLGEEQARTFTRLQETGKNLATSSTEIGALHQSLWDMSGHAEERAAELAKLHEEHRGLNELADERRAMIASLETRVTGLEVTLEDLRHKYVAAERNIADRVEAISTLAQERDLLRGDIAGVTARRDQLHGVATEQSKRVAELERAHRIERRARTKFENEVAAAKRLLADAMTREKTTESGFERQLEDAAAKSNELRQQIENLRAENAALEGALDVTRREFTLMRSDRAAAPAPEAAVNAEEALRLRASISEVGSQVSRLMATLQNPTPDETPSDDAAQPIAERVRALQTRAKRAVPNH